jgi:hypothetical protein
MGRFASVVEAEASQKGNYMPHLDSKTRVEILNAKFLNTRAGKPSVVVAVRILEVLAKPTVLEDKKGNAFPPVGVDKDWFCSLAPVRDGSKPGEADLKKFVAEVDPDCAALIKAFEEEQDTAKRKELAGEFEEMMDMIVGPDQPFAGVHIDMETVAVFTKAGDPFTRHVWSNASAAS